MPNLRSFGLLLLLCGCGGRLDPSGAVEPDGPEPNEPTVSSDASVTDASPIDASATVHALVQYEFPTETAAPSPTDEGTTMFQCLGGSLPIDNDGRPDCVVVRAQFPAGQANQGTAGDIALCKQCAAAGLEPFTAPVPLDAVADGLSKYQCVCAVKPQSIGAACPTPSVTSAAWCYNEAPLPNTCSAGNPSLPGPILSLSLPALVQGFPGSTTVVYAACFAPQTTP